MLHGQTQIRFTDLNIEFAKVNNESIRTEQQEYDMIRNEVTIFV